MNLWESILLSVTGLMANKMRALLTMLGIIIGIGSVIGIVTVGDSLTGSVSSGMQEMGANNVTLTVQRRDNTVTAHMTDKELISADMIDALMESYARDIDAVSFTRSIGSGKIKIGRDYANVNVTGVSGGYKRTNNLALLEGRFLSQRDEDDFRKVAVVSDRLVENLFPKESPLGKTIDFTSGGRTDTFTIVGVYEYVSTNVNDVMTPAKDITTSVLIPLSTANKRMSQENYRSVTLLTSVGTDSLEFARVAEKFMEKFYKDNKNFRISTFSMQSMIETISGIMDSLKIAISCIAAISLVVGGIGVMNIMLVSITERTKEIGTRKAIGATNASIRTQFIVEAVIICLIGGIIGILLGLLIGAVGVSVLGFEAKASVPTIVLAVGFSMAIGIFFGYYPANKAAKLDPIEALRYE